MSSRTLARLEWSWYAAWVMLAICILMGCTAHRATDYPAAKYRPTYE